MKSRCSARGRVRTCAEKMPLHLLGKILARLRVGQIEAILVHQHLLMLQPLPPRLFGNVLENPLAKLAWVGREARDIDMTKRV